VDGVGDVSATTTAGLGFDRTLPRELAHRRAIGEVFVTDTTRLEDDAFAVAAQIPPSHALWGDHPESHHDPLALVEASRQATFVVVHHHLGVPLGPPFVLRHIEIAVPRLDALARRPGVPLEGVFRFALTDRDHRAETLTGISFTAAFAVRDTGAEALTLAGEVAFLSRGDYDALRAFGRAAKPLPRGRPLPPAPIAPHLRSRAWPVNTVVGDPDPTCGGALPVIVSETHPAFYDHPQDHVPGPLLLEAFRQAAIAEAVRSGVLPAPRAALTTCTCAFTDFAEPEAPLHCSAQITEHVAPAVNAVCQLHQLGKQIGSATLAFEQII
jgi:hypothetical protein